MLKLYKTPKHKIRLSPEIFDLDDGSGDASVMMVVTRDATQPQRRKSNKPDIETPWQKDK